VLPFVKPLEAELPKIGSRIITWEAVRARTFKTIIIVKYTHAQRGKR
jgi:hypothetical protein